MSNKIKTAAMNIADSRKETKATILYSDGSPYSIKHVNHIYKKDGTITVVYSKTIDGAIKQNINEEIPADIVDAVVIEKRNKTLVFKFTAGIDIYVTKRETV